MMNAVAFSVADRRLTVADLSPDQKEAYDGVLAWLNRGAATKRTLTLAGYAGVGKSAVISVLAHELLKIGPVAFVTFTGKASSVLSRKLSASGIQTVSKIVPRREDGSRPFEPRPYCGTIHGLVYRPCDKCMQEAPPQPHNYGGHCRQQGAHHAFGCDAAQEGKPCTCAPCLGCDPPPPKKKDGPCNRCRGARFLRRDVLDRGYKLIVADEASMISNEILDVLLSYGISILAVGDHGQLPPVRGTGSLMKSPDLKLERIHRQAEGSPIIMLSKAIRETGDIDDSLEDGEAFTILARRHLKDWIGKTWTKGRLAADPLSPEGALSTLLISWTNKLRVALNYDVRDALGFGDSPPKSGEVLICLKNAAPIYNGMRGILIGDAERAGDAGGKAPKWKASIDFCEDVQKAENILLSEHQFFAEKTIDFEQAQELGVSMAALGSLYDIGYALTAHKCQGSQAHEVCVVIEPGLSRLGRDDRTRWVYTSCTRSSSRLVVVRG